MASISTGADGRRRILFVAADGKRKQIRLGFLDHDEAVVIKKRVAALNAAARRGTPWDPALAKWVAGIGEDLADKLAAVGLVQRRTPAPEAPANKLEEFLSAYIAGRVDHKPNTRRTIDQARRLLVEHFGADKPVDKITAADAKNWRDNLRTRFKPATIATHVKRAKQMFQHAVDKEIIFKSPFAKVKAGKQVDSSRQVFVSRDMIQAVIEAAPDCEWRLIIALARFGGLRVPSEILALTWPDVDWQRSRFRVDSPKTGVRMVPIFPELKPLLEEAFELAQPGAEHVITRYRDPGSNLRTQFMRIIRRAALEPWERLFHNLRSTRQTELTETFPAHAVATWLGNSVKVAAEHYLQTTEEHFRKAAQNPAQYGADWNRTVSQDESEEAENPAFCEGMRDDTSLCGASEYPRQESNL